MGYPVLPTILVGLVAIFGKIGVHGIDSAVATRIRAAIWLAPLDRRAELIAAPHQLEFEW